MVVIRGDDTPYSWGNAEQFTSSGALYGIGKDDWETYTLESEEEIKPDLQSVTIYLIFSPKTSGIIYFDFVSYEFIEN